MTIKDIARLSGCGVATVSSVINNYPDVSPETRKRVMEVLEKYHFEPNSNARHLKQQNGRRVAVVVKGIQNMLFAGMVEQIQQRLQENGIDAAVYYLDENEKNVLKCYDPASGAISTIKKDVSQFAVLEDRYLCMDLMGDNTAILDLRTGEQVLAHCPD